MDSLTFERWLGEFLQGYSEHLKDPNKNATNIHRNIESGKN